MITRTLRCLLVAGLVVVPAAARAAEGDEDIARAKNLYAGAAYDEALTALGSIEGAEARQYRALCLLALGRSADAERELVALLTDSPRFAVSDEDVPPRFATLFSQTKRVVLPQIARQLFADARQDYQGKSYEPALDKFERAVAIAGDPSLEGVEGMTDITLLASGFIDLAKNAVATTAKATAPTPSRTEGPTEPLIARTASPTPGAANVNRTPQPSGPSGPAPATGKSVTAAAGVAAPAVAAPVTAPVAINQAMPAWPRGTPRLVGGAVGIVRVVIGVDGTVKEATMQVPIVPGYDREIIQAARNWRYRPAMRNGSPVESEQLITIKVEP